MFVVRVVGWEQVGPRSDMPHRICQFLCWEWVASFEHLCEFVGVQVGQNLRKHIDGVMGFWRREGVGLISNGHAEIIWGKSYVGGRSGVFGRASAGCGPLPLVFLFHYT